MKIIRYAFAAFLAAALGQMAEAQNIFNKFQPATGILKGSSTTYVTQAAVSADIIGLWTGSCSASTFLSGAGACAAVSLTSAVTGILPVSNGGIGVGAITGLVRGNGTSAFTVATLADVLGFWSGTCSSSNFLRGDGQCVAAGGNPAGSTGQIQFNTSSAFAASANLAWDNTHGVLILNGSFGGVIGSATGQTTQMDGGDAINDTTSATVSVGSNGTSGAGGTVNIAGGNAATSGSGGAIQMNSGNAAGSLTNGGTIQLNTGAGAGGGSAGNIVFDINGVTKLQITGAGGVEAGTPTGGDKGSGTINAQGLYVNGAAVGTGSGTVTSVTCGTGLTGGTFTTSGTCALSTPVSVANGGTGTASPGSLSGTGITVSGSFPTQTVSLSTPVSVANGGTGTASPGIVAGTNITVTGTWPNQTVNSTASGPSNSSGTATLATGCSTTPALTYNAVQIGNHVTLTLQHYGCTASGSPTNISFSGVAGGLLPGNSVDVIVPMQNAGSSVVGECQVASGGISCHPLAGGTMSGTIGLGGVVNSSDIVLNYSTSNP